MAIRGDRGEGVGKHVDDVTKELAHLSDAQLLGANELIKGQIGVAQGDFEAAFEHAMRAMDVDAIFVRVGSMVAGMAALLARDVERARAASERLVAPRVSGRLIQVQQVLLRAGVAALEGRHAEAVSGFREAIQRFRGLGVFFNLAQAGLAFGLAVALLTQKLARPPKRLARSSPASKRRRGWSGSTRC